MIQQDLPLWTLPKPFKARGKTFRPDRDSKRLGKQCQDIYDAMKDGAWHTLPWLHDQTGWPEASISARLRDLRNQFGFTIDREYVIDGLHRYRMAI